MDVLVPTTMKNAAKCDTSCELQSPASHQMFERTWHCLTGSMLFGVSVYPLNMLHMFEYAVHAYKRVRLKQQA